MGVSAMQQLLIQVTFEQISCPISYTYYIIQYKYKNNFPQINHFNLKQDVIPQSFLIVHFVIVQCQQMQQEIPKLQNDDSDNDEGFIVHAVQIKQREVFSLKAQPQSRPSDYQPRYIFSNNLIKKQPPELVNSYPHFQKEQQFPNEVPPKRKARDIMHPQQRYFSNKNYRLVYQRNNRRVQQDDSYCKNDISLSSVVSYCSDNYSLVKNWEIPQNNEQLHFQSRFESGNLALAYKSLIQNNHYVLFIQNDTNTKGYNKWFYFAVKNAKKNVTYTFSIVNLRKYFAFFKHGMKPIRFSQQEHKLKGNGWSRCGKNIQIYRSQLSNRANPEINLYYTLTFQIQFEHDNDINFISLLPPYSYTKLINFLQEANNSIKDRENFKFEMKTIGYTLGNTQVPYITISSSQPSKKNIVILARQHPGEVWSSYLTESIIRQLMRESNPQRDWLLRNYTFRIFPMVNIDGVIYGNFRCDLSGMDLNRCWKNPNKLIHPHLCAIKEELMRLSYEQQISCCLDMHSHSKDYNIFAYCCKTDNSGRVLPLLFAKASPLFHFPSCTFGISKYKESTARATIYEFSKTNDVLTIQISFFAFNNPLRAIHPSIFLNFANAILKSLKSYYSKSKDYLQAEQALPKALAEMAQLRIKNKQSYDNQSGSDSQPQCDQIAIKEKIGSILPKCNTVQIALGLISQEKQQAKSKQQPKKVKKLKHLKLDSRSFDRNSKDLSTIEHKNVTTPLIAQRNSLNSHQIMLRNVLSKFQKRKQERRGQKQIEKQQVSIIINKNQHQSLQLPPARISMQKNFLTTGFRETLREKGITKYELHYKVEKRQEEEFPLLCVLSDRKKQAHLQKLKRIHPTPTHRDRPVVRYQPTLTINKKLDTMDRLRERQKNSSELVSSIWKQQSTVNDYPIRSIFYGGL